MRVRLILAVIVALFVSATYFMQSSHNPITGETQRVALSHEQEIALGLHSAPQMAARFGGITPSPFGCNVIASAIDTTSVRSPRVPRA